MIARMIAGVAVFMMMTSLSYADGTNRFARRLNRHPVLHHSPFARGPEVVYRSSGRATKQAAIASWQNSPPHAALLPRVTNIVCRGRVCVGR